MRVVRPLADLRRRDRGGRGRGGRRRSATAPSSSSPTSSAAATSRCRSCRHERLSATGTARSSAATRRWSRRRRPPGCRDEVRAALHEAARRAAEAIDYRGAGTVEFLYDPATERFCFLEMNTRLQVEHPVTELVHGVDLVELQLAVAEARGSSPALARTVGHRDGHAIEVRLYAEDPAADYQPQSGVLHRCSRSRSRTGIRVDSGLRVRQRGLHVLRRDAGQGGRARADPRAGGPQAGRRPVPRPDPRRTHQPRPAGRGPARPARSSPVRCRTRPAPVASTRPSTRTGGSAPRRPPRSPWPSWTGSARTVQQGIPVGWRNVASQPQRHRVRGRHASSSGGAAATATSSTAPRWSARRARTSVALEHGGVRTTYEVAVGPPDARRRRRLARSATPRCGVRRGSPTRPTRWPAAACWRRCPAPSSASPSSRASRSRPASRCWSSRR